MPDLKAIYRREDEERAIDLVVDEKIERAREKREAMIRQERRYWPDCGCLPCAAIDDGCEFCRFISHCGPCLACACPRRDEKSERRRRA